MATEETPGVVNLRSLARAATLAAMAAVLAVALRFPLLAAAPFLLYEPSDVPLLVGAIVLGPGWGAAMALAVAAVLAPVGGAIGAVSRFLGSATLGVAAGHIYRRLPGVRGRLWLAIGGGILAYVLVEILATLALGPLFLGIGLPGAVAMLLPVVIPFNLVKGLMNGAVAGVIVGALSRRNQAAPHRAV